MVVLIKVLVDTHATGCKTQQLNYTVKQIGFLVVKEFAHFRSWV
jgi:hypothetical protein